jgi:hypothetical protein
MSTVSNYSCPKHGHQDSFYKVDGRNFCFKCTAEKLIELGVCELKFDDFFTKEKNK